MRTNKMRNNGNIMKPVQALGSIQCSKRLNLGNELKKINDLLQSQFYFNFNFIFIFKIFLFARMFNKNGKLTEFPQKRLKSFKVCNRINNSNEGRQNLGSIVKTD